MKATARRAYTVGATGMVVWCVVMLVVGETIAAGISWVLGVWAFVLSATVGEEAGTGQ